MAYGISLKWLAVSSFEMRFGDLSVVSDPYITECVTTDLTWEVVEKCDLITLSHAHWDHITDIPRLAEKFRPKILCGDQTVYPMAQWLNYYPHKMYPMYPDTELDFGAVKIKALYGRHKGMGKGVNDLCERHRNNPLCQKDPGMAQLQFVGNMEYRNYLFTTPNGTKLLLWGSMPTPEQLAICRAAQPDIAIIQRGTKPADILDKARFAAQIGCKVLIPHHQNFTEIENPALLQQLETDFLSLVPDGRFVNPVPGEWIHL